MINKLEKPFLILFLISIFLFKIPNFYIIPIFKNPFITSQALSRIIIIITFVYQTIIHTLARKKIFSDRDSRIIVLFIVIFFLLQSLSIVAAINLGSFLSRYKDVIISFLSFFVFFFYRHEYKKIINVFILSTVVNLIYQSLIVFFPIYTLESLSQLIYQKHLDLVLAKLDEGRVYTDTYDEIIFPFILANFTDFNFVFLFIGIVIFTLLSNIRSRLLMMFISLVGSIFFIKKIGVKKVFIFTFSFLIAGFFINNLMRSYFGFSYIDRLVLEDEIRDVKPINFRWEQIRNASFMAWSIFFGVGLGNYYDNLDSLAKNKYLIVSKRQKITTQGAQEFVHNIFGAFLAESGFLSLFLFLIILGIFIKEDLIKLEQKDNNKKAFIIAFWSLFAYGLFNPISPASYQILFWGLRALLL